MNLANLANLPNLAKMFNFYNKYFKLSSKCSQYRFQAFQNEIKYYNLNVYIFKGFLIFTEFGSKIRLICQLSLNFGKTQIKQQHCSMGFN